MPTPEANPINLHVLQPLENIAKNLEAIAKSIGETDLPRAETIRAEAAAIQRAREAAIRILKLPRPPTGPRGVGAVAGVNTRTGQPFVKGPRR